MYGKSHPFSPAEELLQLISNHMNTELSYSKPYRWQISFDSVRMWFMYKIYTVICRVYRNFSTFRMLLLFRILKEKYAFLDALYMDQVYSSILYFVTWYAFATRETFEHKHLRPLNKISSRLERIWKLILNDFADYITRIALIWIKLIALEMVSSYSQYYQENYALPLYWDRLEDGLSRLESRLHLAFSSHSYPPRRWLMVP